MGRSIFADSHDADASFGSEYFKDGAGLAVILECLDKTSNDEHKFIARMKILEVTPKPPHPANSVGEQVGIVFNYTKHPKVAKPNTQKLILAIVGCKKEEITKEDFVATAEDCVNYQSGATSEFNGRKIEAVQAARGMLVRWETYRAPTKAQKAAGKGETMTFVNFTHVPGQSPADIAARRAELDKEIPIRG